MMLKGITKKFIISFLVTTIAILFVMPFNVISANTSTELQSNACYNFYASGTSDRSNNVNTFFNLVKGNNDKFTGVTYTLSGSFTRSYYGSLNDTCSGSVLGTASSNSTKLFASSVYYMNENTSINWSNASDFAKSLDYYDWDQNTTFSIINALSIVVPNDQQETFSYVSSSLLNANVSYPIWSGTDPYYVQSTQDVYAVGLGINHLWFISENNFSITLSDSRHNYSYNASTFLYDGQTYYYIDCNYLQYSSSYSYYIPWYNESQSNYYLAYFASFNNRYPDVTYGDLDNVGYYTRFINSQQASFSMMRKNLDVINWESTRDTQGNLFDDSYSVEIQAYAIEYSASTESDLLNLIIEDLGFIGSPVTIGTVPATAGRFEITWGEVSDIISDNYILTNILDKLLPHFVDNFWVVNGWVYRLRLLNEAAEFVGDWQTIYQLTSYDVQDSQQVINYYVTNNNQYPNQPTEQIINNINQTNNTTNNWYVNDVPLGYDTNGQSWWEILLEKITYLIGLLVDAISGIGSSIINGIFDLISNLGVNILDTFNNLWNGFINLFNGINFTDDNPNFDLDFGLQEGDSPLDIVPAFIRMINSSGLGYMLWLPLVVGIIFMVL